MDYKKILGVINEYYQICIEFSEYKEAITILKYTRELCESEKNKGEKILLLINLSIAYSYFHACNGKECIIKAEEICSVIFENEDNQLYQNVLHAKHALENLGYVF